MKSLLDLNSFSNLTVEYTDDRDATVILDRLIGTDQSLTITENEQFVQPTGFILLEIVDSAVSQPYYTLDYTSFTGQVTLDFGVLPAGVVVTESPTNYFTITGVDTVFAWDGIKSPTVQPPFNEIGSKTITATLNWTLSDGVTTDSITFDTALTINDAQELDDATAFTYLTNTLDQSVTGVPLIIAALGGLTPIFTLTIEATKAEGIASITATDPLDGVTTVTSTTTTDDDYFVDDYIAVNYATRPIATLVITGEKAPVNTALGTMLLSTNQNGNPDELYLKYTLTNNQSSVTDIQYQELINYELLAQLSGVGSQIVGTLDVVKFGASLVASSFSATITPNKIHSAGATLNTSANVDCDINVIRGLSPALSIGGFGTVNCIPAQLTNELRMVYDVSLTTSNAIEMRILAGTGSTGLDFDIDWGDGNVDTYTTDTAKSHTYTTAQSYTVRVTSNNGQLIKYSNGYIDATDKGSALVECIGLGPEVETANFRDSDNFATAPSALETQTTQIQFFDCVNFNDSGIKYWDTADLTTMESMFLGCTSFNQDISSWDMAGKSNLFEMFSGCSSFNQPLNAWDTADATRMDEMFKGCTSFNQDLDQWDVGSVTTFNDMFNGCTAFNGDVTTWTFALSFTMSGVFAGCTAFDQDLGVWDIAGCTDTSRMFSGCSSFDQDVTGWDVADVTDMSSMFAGCSSFDQNLSLWDVGGVSDFSNMFNGCTLFNQPLNSWDTASATNMGGMFEDCLNFGTSLSLWDTAGVTDMSRMFDGATSFNHDITTWDTASVTTMNSMFRNATSFNQDIDSWDTSSVGASGMDNMFNTASAFDQDISSWCVANITSKPTGFDTSTLTSWTTAEKPSWGSPC